METFVKQEKNSLFKSVMWVSFSNIATRAMFFISSIITAKLLTADDFGIIGMAATFTNFILSTGSVGITHYLIYKQGINEEEIRSVFLIQTVLSLFFSGLLIAGGPIIANIYHTPEVANITIIAGFALLASWIGFYPRAYLIKQMKQNIVAKIETVGSFINFSLIIILAVLGFKYLSYVIPMLVSQVITACLYINSAKIKPSFKINIELYKDVFKYGKSFMPQQLLIYFTEQLDYIIAGYFLGKMLLGYYYFGFEKAVLIVLIIKAIAMSSFSPVFSENQFNKEKLKEKFISLNDNLAFVFFPVIFLMIFMAKELMHFVFGSNWNASILTFQLILAYCFFKIFFEMAIILFNSTGRPEQNLRHYLIMLPIYIVGFYMGVKLGGITGLSIAAFSVHSFSSLLIILRIKKVFGWTTKTLCKTNMKIILILLLQLPIIWPLKLFLESLKFSNLLMLVIICFLSIVIYLFTTKHFLKNLYNGVITLITHKIMNKFSMNNQKMSEIYEET